MLLLVHPMQTSALKKVIFTLLPLFFLLLFLEGALRVYFAFQDTRSALNRSFSDTVGWETDPHIHATYRHPETGQVSHYSTQDYGFRVFGDARADTLRVLVLGDSFTEAKYINDGQTYYDYLKANHPRLEIFAYGSAGFGSLQEYLILERFWDKIEPDIVLWQFSGNDIINNDHELESLSLINNNHMTRPYDENGRVTLRYPEQLPRGLYTLINHSFLIRFLKVKMGFIRAQLSDATIERRISETDPRFRRSAETTVRILKKIKKRAGQRPVVAFNANQGSYIRDFVFEEIAREAGVYFVPGLDAAIQEARKRGQPVVVSEADDHWTAEGHALAGQKILEFLTEKNLVS